MTIGLCLADPHPDEVSDGSNRTISATHFAGRYRLVDFTLSNMVNSGIYSIAIILNSQYQNLITHIGTGKEWDLSRKSGGVTLFPPYLTDDRMPYSRERDEALRRALDTVSGSKAEYVILTDCATLYNIDFRDVLATHRQNGGDITAVYSKKQVMDIERQSVIHYILDERGRLTGIQRAAYGTEDMNVSLGAFVLPKTTLLQLLARERFCDIIKFTREILAGALKSLKVIGYNFQGYSARIFSLDTFFYYNMDMLDSKKRNSLFFNQGRNIYTSGKDSLPTKYGANARITNSIVADGCQIDGAVENCVMFRNVRVKEGAVVKNSILQMGATVEKNAELDWIIADTSVIVTENRKLMGSQTYPVYISREKIV
ncbi:MAG: glucose-1-phosphate adenylyltransferase subunit GlgD [Peptococcaceae bacterium]|jgi:glucose-1-phosphate adenylyltransferase|nr:glucose-1-phosphate adenylyltransferase subunit GlgD [Peptococcaceae bacterium]